MTNELIKKHLKRYYQHKGNEIRQDDILPVSRIIPLINECVDAARKDEAMKYEQLLERASGLVGNPGCNISASTDLACEQWQKDYQLFKLSTMKCKFRKYGEVEKVCSVCGYVIPLTDDDAKALAETINSTSEVPKCQNNSNNETSKLER